MTPASGFGVLGLAAQSVLATGNLADLEISDRDLMYLGQQDGTAVLYDLNTAETLRVPAGDIVISSGSYVEETVSFRPGHGLDLDRNLEPYEQAGPEGVVGTRDINPRDIEVSWQGDRLLLGTRLDPNSDARAGIVEDDVVPGRSACARVEPSVDQIEFHDLRSGLRICVHTTEDRWALLTVTSVRHAPRELDLQVTTWPV